jgi:hypothetical protein
VSADLDDFDMLAAQLRRSQTDLGAFMEAFAARMEGALPGKVKVERRSNGLFSNASHVARVAIDADRAVYDLSMVKGTVVASRAKVVRGVRLSSTDLPVGAWLAEVRAAVEAHAQAQDAASDGLHDFL